MGFLSRKKKEPVVQENPYANPITPYQQARNDLAKGAMPGGPGSLPSNPRMNSYGSSPAPPPYQSPAPASNNPRFGDDKYGNQNGYGSNRYDNENASSHSANSRRPGGYGGFGDEGRSNELFGGAAGRYAPPEQASNGPAPSQFQPNRYNNDDSKGALLGNAQNRYNPLPPSNRQEGPAEDDEFGGYGAPRELTEEEKDEQGYQNIRSDIKNERRAMADTADRINQTADTALDAALHGYAELGAQDDRLRRADQNLNSAAAYSRVAEDKTKELKNIQSMFSVFSHTSNSKIRKQDAAVLERHQMEKRQQEATARGRYKATEDMEETFMSAHKSKPGLLGANANKKKYDFVDLEDGEDENELSESERDDMRRTNDAMDAVQQKVQRMNLIAKGMNRRITDQNELLTDMAQKSDAVDDHVRMNREKLKRIG
ncbi:hypothetical protein DHEL01_v200850 [Diaporthe helianthi]|uniref:t-SNARE coiled-coil homology domain-containing protein n=1 Tax=Diaporthe helianthi TaxID=158607 RepID=A0A2P5IE28_DIAHE|nr:hypothetical protein DHEL01_v200850 [Diaporthe helianthi]